MNTRYQFRYACIAVMCIFITMMLCGCQHHPKAQMHGKPQTPTTKLAFPESEIPGEYYLGDSALVNSTFKLEVNHRFTLDWRGCMGGYHKQGSWELNGDVLTVYPVKSDVQDETNDTMEIRYIPVKWGNHHFLIDENKMPGFCAESARFDPAWLTTEGYAQSLRHYIKVEKAKGASASSKPLIPARYHDFFTNGPIEANVIKMTDTNHAFINKGSLDRVKPGMLFCIIGPGDIDLEVISVSKHKSEVRPIYYSYSEAHMKVSTHYTTGIDWNNPQPTDTQRFSEPPGLPELEYTTPKGGKSGKR